MKHTRTTITIALLALVGTSAGLIAPAIANSNTNSSSARVSASEPDSSQRRAMDLAFNISDAFEYAAEIIEPSVVHITVRNSPRANQSEAGLGSGVIVDQRGYILTNAHVVEQGRFITVRLSDGRELEAELIGAFPETDIAVVKVQADDIEPAEFTDSEAVRVGQWVLAVGSPFGFEQTVTAGIVSAKGRGSTSPHFAGTGGFPTTRLQEFIQTDAAINPGNSGGPLVDLHGNIVGINTAIISRTGSNNGLGFSIPSDIAKAVMEQIIDTGRVERGWLGINMQPLSPVDAHKLDIEGGVVIQRIIDDGPAMDAGLLAGDIIIAVGGRSTENTVRLSNAIMLIKPNDPVEIDFIRDGKVMNASAVVSDRDDGMVLANGGATLEEIGVNIVPDVIRFNRGRRQSASLPGYFVTYIDRDSPAELKGLEQNDFIYQIDDRSFDSADDVETFLSSRRINETVRVQFYRGTQRMYVDLTPNPSD
jgi:serine protease Do